MKNFNLVHYTGSIHKIGENHNFKNHVVTYLFSGCIPPVDVVSVSNYPERAMNNVVEFPRDASDCRYIVSFLLDCDPENESNCVWVIDNIEKAKNMSKQIDEFIKINS